jgi:hypothetical protein
MITAAANMLGWMALVAMITTVARVVMVKLWESAKVNPEYVQSVYDNDLDRQWSGVASERPSLLSPQNLAVVAPPKASPPQASPSPGTESDHDLQTSVIQDIESKRSKIESTVRGFFEAKEVEQKLAFARDPQRVRPLMEDYYRNHPKKHLVWKGLGWILPVEEPGYRLGYAQALFTDADPVSIIIEEQKDGSFRIDWESSVRYGEIDWKEFIRTKPESPKLFRVIASKARHTPPGEAAPQNTEVLEIKHPDGDDTIYAWFDRKDPKFLPLIQQLQSGNWNNVPLTLRLCYPGFSESGRSVKIADVEGKGWLILQGTKS